MPRIKIVDAPAAPSTPPSTPPTGRAAVFAHLNIASPAVKAERPEREPFVPAQVLACVPAKVWGHGPKSEGKVWRAGDGYVALLAWPSYTDKYGNTYPETLRVGRIKSEFHRRMVFDDATGLVKEDQGEKMLTLTREDLATFSGAWESLIAEAKRIGTMK